MTNAKELAQSAFYMMLSSKCQAGKRQAVSVCDRCGCAYESEYNTRYCSKRCRKQASRARCRARRNPPITINCAVCGVTCTRVRKNAPPKTCGSMECVKTHRLRIKYAKEAGVSYDEYVSGKRKGRTPKPRIENSLGLTKKEAENIIIEVKKTFKWLRKTMMKSQGVARCYSCNKIKPIGEFKEYNLKPTMGGRCTRCERRRLRGTQSKRSQTAAAKAYRKAYRERKSGDPVEIIKKHFRGRFQKAVKRYGNGDTMPGRKIEYLGCSVEDACKYIEGLFKRGMTWSNYGKWHVDHVIPCASFDLTRDEERAKCFHYTNLQPLWALDNMRKSASTGHEHQPGLLI